MVCTQMGIKKPKKLEIKKIKDLKIGIGIEKSYETRLKIMLRIHLIISLSCILNTHLQICYPMHTTEIPILTSWHH